MKAPFPPTRKPHVEEDSWTLVGLRLVGDPEGGDECDLTKHPTHYLSVANFGSITQNWKPRKRFCHYGATNESH